MCQKGRCSAGNTCSGSSDPASGCDFLGGVCNPCFLGDPGGGGPGGIDDSSPAPAIAVPIDNTAIRLDKRVPARSGVMLMSDVLDSAGNTALKRGDLILRIDGEPCTHPSVYTATLYRDKTQPVEILYYRVSDDSSALISIA